MRYRVITLVLAGMLGVLPMAAGGPGETTGGGPGETTGGGPGEVALMAIGGQNRTWAGYGGGALQASLPVWEHLDIQAGLQGLSSGVMTGLLHIQPVFPLKEGELFADVTGYYGGFYKYSTKEWLAGGSFGWRNAHVSAQVGLSVRWILDRNGAGKIVEPIDPLYRIAYRLKTDDAPWNLTGGMANYTRYQVERAMQPVFFLEGRYRLSQQLSLIGEVNIKPTGMFHLTATWYGFSAGLGISYRFAL